MALKWDAETMATGVEEIDRQHRELFGHLNEFFRLMSLGKADKGLHDFVDFLTAYTEGHFRHEEACMNLHRCPVAGANKSAHAQFIRLLGDYRARLTSEGPTTKLVIEVQREVSDWVRNHIIRTDTHMRQCVG